MVDYATLMMATDGAAASAQLPASEETFNVLKDLEQRNLLVPVVGNFGGPKALRAVGKYIRDRGATVAALYLSNVEQYLRQDGIWDSFCANVASMPLTSRARSSARSGGGGGRRRARRTALGRDAGRDEGCSVPRASRVRPVRQIGSDDPPPRGARAASSLALLLARAPARPAAAAADSDFPASLIGRGVLAAASRPSPSRRLFPLRQPRLQRRRVPARSFPICIGARKPGRRLPRRRARAELHLHRAMRPRIAFIIDIRRGNLQLHLHVQGAVRAVGGPRRVPVAAVLTQAARRPRRRRVDRRASCWMRTATSSPASEATLSGAICRRSTTS